MKFFKFDSASTLAYLHSTIFSYTLTAIAGFAVGFTTVTQCGQAPYNALTGGNEGTPAPTAGQPVPAPGPAPETPAPTVVTCDGLPVGYIKNLPCPAGQNGAIVEVCQADGTWKQAGQCTAVPDNGPGQGGPKKTVFADVKTIFDQRCVGCHAVYGDVDGDPKTVEQGQADAIKKEYEQILNEVRLDEMPQGTNKLTPEQKAALEKWKSDGFLFQDNSQASSFLTLDDFNVAAVTDALEVERAEGPGEAEELVYLMGAHKVNQGASDDELAYFRAGTNKAVNSISKTEDIVRCVWVGPANSICRLKLDDAGLTTEDWNTITDADQFKFPDNTTAGKELQRITRKRRPFLHMDNFAFISNQPAVYYKIRGLSHYRDEYLKTHGVDIVKQIDEREAIFGGGNGSPISLTKNRVSAFFESNDGYCAITFDPVNTLAERNFFDFPLFFQGLKRAVFDASETICEVEKEEGTQLEYALWNAQGVRQDEAPTNIVRDTLSRFQANIVNSFSCQGCHDKGMIPFEDQIRNHVLNGGGNLGADDKKRVEISYGTQSKIDGVLAAINGRHRKFLNAIQEPGNVGVYNYLTDRHRKDMSLAEFCGWIMVPVPECSQKINASTTVRAKIGQLLTGGSISFDQRINVLPDVIRDFPLGEDPR